MFNDPREYILYMAIHADFAAQPTAAHWRTLRDDLFENQVSWSFLARKLAGSDATLSIHKFSEGTGQERRWALVRLDIPKRLFPAIKAHLGTTTLNSTVTAVINELQAELQSSARDALGLSQAQSEKITIPVNEGSVVDTDEQWTALKASVSTYLQNNAAIWYAAE